jgi:protein arginine kinase activator
MRRVDFKKTGRLGCPTCYETFQDELTPLLRAMHRHERHAGKVPSVEGQKQKHSADVEALNRALDKAISAEHFEEAARLRDELKGLRKAIVNS